MARADSAGLAGLVAPAAMAGQADSAARVDSGPVACRADSASEADSVVQVLVAQDLAVPADSVELPASAARAFRFATQFISWLAHRCRPLGSRWQ